MLNTIELNVMVAAPLGEVLEWCRTADARALFPGAKNVRALPDGMAWEVGIRAPGAAAALVTVDEYLKAHGREPGGVAWFETSQVWTWPNRECATSWHMYRFAKQDGKTELDFRWRYILPGLAGAQVFNAMRFSRSIERAAEIYIERLSQKFG